MTDTPTAEDEVVTVDVDLRGPFTLDEVVEIESLTGVPYPRWFDGFTVEGELRRAIVFVLARRTRPEVTLADAGAVLVAGPSPNPKG